MLLLAVSDDLLCYFYVVGKQNYLVERNFRLRINVPEVARGLDNSLPFFRSLLW
jgi:hypothetical protein